MKAKNYELKKSTSQIIVRDSSFLQRTGEDDRG